LVSRYAGNPRIRLVNAAVAESDGKATLYVPSSEASGEASLIAHHHSRFGSKKGGFREVVVPSLTVTSLVKQCKIEKLDILQLDTEGMDYQILNWFFAAGIEPSVINFESLHLGKKDRQACRDLLRGRGYWWIDTDQDTFVVKESLVRTVKH
jgi:FkbM family methyltransferase